MEGITEARYLPIEHRYDLVVLYDVRNGNPNGDPDMDGMPRCDPETGVGIVSDVCIKRKVRNYVSEVCPEDAFGPAASGRPGRKIYVERDAVLNDRHRLAYEHLGLEPADTKLPADEADAAALTRFMCDNFWDVRTFGAVMTTGVNCGQVRGPVQLAFGRSVEPVFPTEASVTRMAATNDSPRGERGERGKDRRTFGQRHYVPYGLYRQECYVSAAQARRTGFCQDDMDLLVEALANMFELDRSASRGQMETRMVVVFEHSGVYGSARSQDLFDLVRVRRAPGSSGPARDWSDYEVTLDEAALPAGVTARVLDRVPCRLP